MDLKEFGKRIEENQLNWSKETENQFFSYRRLLQDWNQRINLTTITQDNEVVEKHFWDSALPFLPYKMEGTLCDVGTGAGFPGAVLAILYPNLEVTLLDPTKKRCVFLEEVRKELGLKNIVIVNQRAEESVNIYRDIFDYTTARAVAQLNILSELCLPLTKVGGMFIAMKGSNAKEELESAQNAITTLGGQIEQIREDNLPSGDGRINIYIRKESSTPTQYPRDYSQIKKKPL